MSASISRLKTVRMMPATPCHVPVVEVHLTERSDAACLPAVRPVLDAAPRLRPLALDVAGCATDAAGLGLPLDAHRDLWGFGARLMSPAPRTRGIPRIAGVDQVLSIVPERSGPIGRSAS